MLQNPAALDVNQLSTQFKSLRNMPSHFMGGQWTDQVDKFGSDKHMVMEEFLRRLGQEGTAVGEVIQHMGSPDRICASKEEVEALKSGSGQAAGIAMMPGPVMNVPFVGKEGIEKMMSTMAQGKTYLVYYWRGAHDFLVFETDDSGEKVKSGGWWNAGE
ncbi:hypothetical protein BKA69DRAFT_1127155 [Paraphysoderma sedebokerense]|nr:hypothetical protein BKA69DRAFT_1127155 [Paraphysoderma sedebokerense]